VFPSAAKAIPEIWRGSAYGALLYVYLIVLLALWNQERQDKRNLEDDYRAVVVNICTGRAGDNEIAQGGEKAVAVVSR
jgi:hypothetical protein